MNTRPDLSEAEWELVIELLQREQSELPTEIHHTRVSAMRDALRKRRESVQQLLTRLQAE